MSELQRPEIYRVILERLQTGVYVVDRERRIVFWNDGAERISGYLRQDVVGRLCRENILVHCDTRGCILCGHACPLGDTINDGKVREAQVYLRHQAGHRVPVHVRSVPVRNPQGLIIGAVESFEELGIPADLGPFQDELAAHGCLDEITGVPTHTFTLSRLREHLATLAELHVHFSIVLVGITQMDHFRATRGRGAVGKMLHAAAQTLRNALRPTDFLGRWTDDRFLAIVDGGRTTVERISERIQQLAACSDIRWWGDLLAIPVALGIAQAQEGDTVESLIARAEAALHHSPGEAGKARSTAEG
jgi:diguanylate cyclase (GGDEF)-like protein/PAS domain S-box-containing protein